MFALGFWFSIKEKRFAVFLSIAVVGLIALYPMTWYMLVRDTAHQNEYGSNNVTQIGFIVHHFEKFPWIILHTIYKLKYNYWISFVGIMGSGKQYLRVWCMVACGVVLILCLWHDMIFSFRRYSLWFTAVGLSLLLLTFVALCTYCYIFASAVGSDLIVGLWGRYFYPLLLFVGLFTGFEAIPGKPSWMALSAVLFGISGLLIINVASLLVVLDSYYYFR